MLVLTRHIDESFFIGDEIEVAILAVNGSQVRIGINAPRNIAVLRTELIPADELVPIDEINKASR
jgi:carbon storage regulator